MSEAAYTVPMGAPFVAWNYTVSSMGTFELLALEMSSHQLARPVASPTQAAAKRTCRTPYSMPQDQ